MLIRVKYNFMLGTINIFIVLVDQIIKKERGYKNEKNTRKTLIKANGMPC